MNIGKTVLLLAASSVMASSAVAKSEDCQTAASWSAEELIDDRALEVHRIRQTFENEKAYFEIDPTIRTDPDAALRPNVIAFSTRFETGKGKYRLEYDVRMGSASRPVTLVARKRPTEGKVAAHLWRKSIGPDANFSGDTTIDAPADGIEFAIIFAARHKSWLWAGPVKLCKV